MSSRDLPDGMETERSLPGQATEGSLADKSIQLVLDALAKAAADPGGVPLYGNRKSPGLFANSASVRLIAERAKTDGYLRVVRAETKGKNVLELCSLTEKGLAFLLQQASPRQVLEELVQTLQSRKTQVDELITTARKWHANLESLAAFVETLVPQIVQHGNRNGSCNGTAVKTSETLPGEIVTILKSWQDSGNSGDCSLPDLFRLAKTARTDLTVGSFHDALRQLQESRRIYLHPWTGPLYEMPEPHYALLAGHEVGYYAST
jgi:hypothetical protein